MWENQMGMNYGGYGQGAWQPGPMQRRSAYGYEQPQQSNMQWIRVKGPQAAHDVSVPPGGEAWIMDENQPVFYYKKANPMGQTETKAFRFEEISLDGAATAGIDMSRFATKDDILAINQRIERLDKFANEMGGINA